MKVCQKCKKELVLGDFNKSSSTKDKLQNWCRACQKERYSAYRKENPELINKKWKRFYDKNRERMIQRTRNYEANLGPEEYKNRWQTYNRNMRFKRYGISEAEYICLLGKQEQKCGMCSTLLNKEKPRSIHIDHNHATGKVRGILCDGCNLFLGRFESDKYRQRVEQAQTYLRKTEDAKDKEP